MRQYDVARAEAECLAFACELVRAKIENSAAVLKRFRANHPDALPVAAVAEVERAAAAIDRVSSLDALRGVEGTDTARYFQAFEAVVPAELGFSGRNRRPPRDPVNALLSFGYVLVGNEIQSLLDGMGFDPYLGFYHQLDYGRPSLAFDLLEEFRAPLVDRWTAALLNRGVLAREAFAGSEKEGVLLTRQGMMRYFPAYEAELTTPFLIDGEPLTFRQLFRRQAERLARALTEGAYRGFRLPC